MYAAIAAFIGAAILLVLTILGFLHLRRRPGDEEMFAARGGGTAGPD